MNAEVGGFTRSPAREGVEHAPYRLGAWRSLLAILLIVTATAASAAASPAAVAAPAGGEPRAPAATSPSPGEALGLTAVVGKVHGELSPIASASVYAYRMADLSLRRVITDGDGRFSFGELPAGLYKVIAHKPGFVPAVVLLTRATAQAFQELEFELALEDGREAGTAEDFWSIRQKIPADVLREMTIAQADALRAVHSMEHELAVQALDTSRFRTQMQALTGVGGFSTTPEAQLTGGLLDVEGRLGKVELDLEGGYRRLAQGTTTSGAAIAGTLGTTSALNVRVRAPGDDTFRVTSHLAEMRQESGGPIDLERYGVEWSGDVGPGRTAVSANYVEESNYYRDPRLTALGGLALPFESRTIELRGTFDTQLSPRSALRTGVTYRNRASDPVTDTLQPDSRIEDRVDLFGLTDLQLSQSVVFHVGMLASMLGESYALSPHTGVTLHLGERWRSEAAVRHRFNEAEDPRLYSDFIPVYFGGGTTRCSEAEADCYRLTLVRALDHDGEVRLGGLLRQYSDTLRVFFSDDFFDQLDSLFFVQGDHVPEVSFSLQHRLGPSVLARFAVNVAHGGGGALEVGDGVYINEVAYLVTSVETHFEQTHTGLELSFHSLGQTLDSAGEAAALAPAVDVDRLQLQVTQDLRSLIGLATDWALLLDMQLSRGADAYHAASDDVRHRVVGGLSVRF